MLKIRGMSILENFLTSVNRFGHGLTIELSHAGHKSVNREAELRAPSGVGCSDFVSPFVLHTQSTCFVIILSAMLCQEDSSCTLKMNGATAVDGISSIMMSGLAAKPSNKSVS